MLHPDMRLYVAGHRGMVGSAIVRRLRAGGFRNLILRSRAELDLTDRMAVRTFMEAERPDYVVLAAAKVGGIHANRTYPAEFIRENLAIELNVIDAAWRAGVERLLFLGSACIYPREVPQPVREEALLTGPVDPTNEPYAVAKIAGIKLCESYNRQYGTRYRCVMPTNLYGPNDNFHPENSHVIPGLMRRFHEAKESGAGLVTVWGTGRPRREFLHVDDLADACVHLMDVDDEVYERHTAPTCSHVNVGSGEEVTIRELAELVAEVVGYEGEIRFDATRPDGWPRKLLDCARLRALGWRPRITLRDGLRSTYAWFVEHEVMRSGQQEGPAASSGGRGQR